jgi:heat shock protein HslJ
MGRIVVIARGLCGLPGCDEGPRTLGDRVFLSHEIQGRELVAGTRLQLHSGAEGELDAWAGCNAMSGSHALAHGRLVTPLYFGTTDKACASPAGDIQAQEDWFRGFIEADPHYMLEGARLVLSDDDVTITFLER